MPERRFDTAYWNEPFIMKLPMKAKLLYLYLWTNIHCNQAGLYEIAIETISWETGLPVEEIPELLKVIEKKVAWLAEQNLVWVKNFLHRQTKSPTFLAAAAKCLEKINNNGLVDEFLAYNKGYTLSIPYQYPIDRVGVAPYSYTLPHSHALPSSDDKGEKGVVKGEVGKLSTDDQEIIEVWRSVSGFMMESPAMVELLSRIRTDCPGIDIVTESRKWAARKISEPLTAQSRPSSQIYNFMANRHKWNQEQKGSGKQRRVMTPKEREAYFNDPARQEENKLRAEAHKAAKEKK